MNFASSEVIGIDAGKNWLHVVVMNSRGRQTDRRTLGREALLDPWTAKNKGNLRLA
jgi:hypothetical protein